MKSIEYDGISKVLPPWVLHGEGYIFVYKVSKSVLTTCQLKPFQQNRVWSIGSMFLVDYKDSPVGPYKELLIVPGVFKMSNYKRFSISKILVSTQASVTNGINNWGIPKELATFQREEIAGVDSWTVRNEDFCVNLQMTHGGISFPISTSLLPLKLGQELDESLVLTTATAKGRAKLAKLKDFKIEGQFPAFDRISPLMGIKVKNFEMIFKKPEYVKSTPS